MRELRGAEPFVEVHWERALDLVAGELRRVKQAYGNEAIFAGSYGWASAGRLHHAQSQVHRFMNAIGGYVRHVTSYSLGAGRTVMPHIVMPMDALRDQHTPWDVLQQDCRLFVAFGGVPTKNLQVNAGGASQHESRLGLEGLARAGAVIVNVSPVRSDLGGVAAAEWIPLRPNTDTAFMLGLAHVLLDEELHNREFLDSHCVGFEPFRRYLAGDADGVPKSPDWAARITGVDPDTIRGLARRMARTRTLVNGSWSLQRADHGEQPFWMLITLAAMLGQIGLPGGGFGFGYGAVNAEGASGAAFSGPVLPQGRNAVSAFIPVARVADMLLGPGEQFDYDGESRRYPHIRIVYWCGGNPFHHHQDLNRLLAAWRIPEAIVVHEQFWTATAKHADIVLPATTVVERDDIGSASRDRFMIAMKKAVDAPGDARDDYSIFSGLAARLGAHEVFTEGRDARGWLEHLYEQSRARVEKAGVLLPQFEEFWSRGYLEIPRPARPQVLLQAFRADPIAHALPTPSGRIEIYSETVAGYRYPDCPGHAVWREPREWLGAADAAGFSLHLLSNQPATKLHSQFDHGTVSRQSKIAGREPIAINPGDASARGLRDGDIARVFNGRGSCLAGVRLDRDVRPGVAVMATGAWFDPEVPGQIGSLDKHGNPNVLTRDEGSSRLSQGCSAQSCLVEVEKFRGDPPPITAFDPPRFAPIGEPQF